MPNAATLEKQFRMQFDTEIEALDYARAVLKVGRFVAALVRSDGSVLAPSQVSARCGPIGEILEPSELYLNTRLLLWSNLSRSARSATTATPIN